MSSNLRAPGEQDLDHALAMSAEMNKLIVAADIKAGLVLAALGVVLAGMTSSLRAAPPQPTAPKLIAVLVLIVASVGVLLLGVTLWPRLKPYGSTWLALPGLHLDPDQTVAARPPVKAMADQGWAQAAALAAIARQKYRWFRAAVLVALVDLALFVTWASVTALD